MVTVSEARLWASIWHNTSFYSAVPRWCYVESYRTAFLYMLRGGYGGLYYCRGLNSSIIVPTMAGKRPWRPVGHPVILAHKRRPGGAFLFGRVLLTFIIIVILHIILAIILGTISLVCSHTDPLSSCVHWGSKDPNHLSKQMLLDFEIYLATLHLWSMQHQFGVQNF